MAVKIKLKRLGRTRVPTYRIVVADARTKRDGRAIEEIGKYHPKEEPSLIEVNSERAQHWLSVGAQPTPPVMNILKITGDWQKFKGEPGAEGTLRVREPAANKKETFAAALHDAGKDSPDSGATTPKGGSRAKKSDSAKPDEARSESSRSEPKGESRRGKPKAGSADEAAGAAVSSEAPAEEAKAAAQAAQASEPAAQGAQDSEPAAQASEPAAQAAQDSEPGSEA